MLKGILKVNLNRFLILALLIFSCRPFLKRPPAEEAGEIFRKSIELMKQKRYDDAIKGFSEIVKNYPHSEFADDAYYLAGVCFYRKEDYKHAKGAGINMLKRYPESSLKEKAMLLVAKSARLLDDYFTAAEYYLKLYEFTQDGKYLKELKNIASRLESKKIKKLVKKTKEKKLKEILKKYEIKSLEREGRLTKKDMFVKIGVLISTTGEFGNIGEAVIRGIETAKKVYDAYNFSIVYTDIGNEKSLLQSFYYLLEQNVDVIIGPLTSKELVILIDSVRQRPVIISPTATEYELLQRYPCLFELNSYAYKEAEEIAKYAIQRLFLQRFAIVCPSDERTREIVSVFENTVKKNGGRIVYMRSYPDTVKDFKEYVLSLKGVDVDAVFLPCPAEHLVTLAPQFDYYKINAVLLGLDDFGAKLMMEKGINYIRNAVFVSPPLPEYFIEEDNYFDRFYDIYTKEYGEPPDWASILGFDTFTILYKTLKETPQKISLCDALKNTKYRRGVIGRLAFGNFRFKNPFVFYEIEKGKIKERK